MFYVQGPAYSEERASNNDKLFIKAVGKTTDMIASYRFHIHLRADYFLWAHVFSISFKNNSFEFRVNEGEWHLWHTWTLSTHELWQNFRFEVLYKSLTSAVASVRQGGQMPPPY